MTEVIEITVHIKDDEKSLKKKFLVYGPISCSVFDPKVKECIDETIKYFNMPIDNPEQQLFDIKVKFTLQV